MMDEDIGLLLLAGDIVERWDDSNVAYLHVVTAHLRQAMLESIHSEPWKARARELISELEDLKRGSFVD